MIMATYLTDTATNQPPPQLPRPPPRQCKMARAMRQRKFKFELIMMLDSRGMLRVASTGTRLLGLAVDPVPTWSY